MIRVTAFNWVPPFARGLVRDLRVRWALEEAGLDYESRTIDHQEKNSPEHRALQPFGQVPVYEEDVETGKPLVLFESGAILLHLGERSTALLPADPRGRGEALEWLFAALNSVEMASLPWVLLAFSGNKDTPAWTVFDDFLKMRLGHVEPILAGREWLAGTFSIADIMMSDVLRLVDRFEGLAAYPACAAYVARATARPAFLKAHADQMAHFAAAD